MRKMNKQQIQDIETQLSPGEKIVEITTTVRWVTTKDLESAAAELKAHTDAFNAEKRITGYVNASILSSQFA